MAGPVVLSTVENEKRTSPALTRDLVALTKPRITSMVLVTTAGGLVLAPAEVSVVTWIATLLGTLLVVSGANALNMYLERDSDRFMARTKNRPLPAGRMSPRLALVVGLATSITSLPIL